MGLLPDAPSQTKNYRAGRDDALLHRMECRACPLAAEASHLSHPHMEPTGAANPLVYVLGEAPGRDEDEQGRQFVGESGQLLRPLVPEELRRRVRWNNCVRTRPPKNRNPTRVEIECCRPSIVRDIEASRPRAIFGFGNVPLEWVTGMTGITLWRGRRVPVKIGDHACWFYPMLHPAWLVRKRRGRNKDLPSEDELMFELDVLRALDEVGQLSEPVVHSAADALAGTEIITEGGSAGLKRIRELLRWAADQPLVGVDYETDGKRPYADGARILTAAVGTRDHAVAFPMEHPDAPWSESELQTLGEMWCEFLSAPRIRRAVHNLAFELEWTGEIFGPKFVRAGEWIDTASQAAVLDERHKKQKRGPFSLDWLVYQYFGFHLKSLFPALDKEKLADTPLETVLAYNAPDAKYHAALAEVQEERIRREGLEQADRLALRRVPTVVLSQIPGAPVNQDEVEHLQGKYDARITALRGKIAEVSVVREFCGARGETFNPLSNPHVHYVFVEMLRRPECLVVDKYSGKEKYSADEAVLSKIDHPLAKLLLELRTDSKRKSTYIDPLAVGSPILYPDGCVHTNFNTYFAATGRLSSDNPNLQNFPKRDDEAAEVRRSIAAPPGCFIISADYGQIEARVIAMFTRDEVFCKALWERYDVHMEWAERIAYAYPKRIGGKKFLKDKVVMKKLRTDIKNQWTFPLFFGASTKSASGYLGIPEDVVIPLYDEFWEQFSGAADWQEEQLAFYRERGYVECLTGRRRRGPLSVNKVYNSPVQGTAAEIVLDAMCRLSETGDPELQPEINIHDDLTFLRVREDRVDDIAEKVLGHMLDVPFGWVNVPITVELAMGRNWMPYDKTNNPDGLQDVADFSSDLWFD